MATLEIYLQDGFADDTVLIHINGSEEYNKSGVSTDYSASLADFVKIQTTNGSIQIQITVVSRKISKLIEFNISETTYLGVSIAEDGIHHESYKSRPAFR